MMKNVIYGVQGKWANVYEFFWEICTKSTGWQQKKQEQNYPECMVSQNHLGSTIERHLMLLVPTSVEFISGLES